MTKQFQEEEKIVRVSNAVAAGTTDSNGTGVNMAGWDSVEFVALLGTLTTTHVTKLKAQQSSDNGSSDDWTDIEGSATEQMADGDSNKIVRLEVVQATKQYVRPVVDRGTANAVIDGVIAILRRARNLPITQDATVSQAKSIVAAPEGTA